LILFIIYKARSRDARNTDGGRHGGQNGNRIDPTPQEGYNQLENDEEYRQADRSHGDPYQQIPGTI